jgi:hypothetical protein
VLKRTVLVGVMAVVPTLLVAARQQPGPTTDADAKRMVQSFENVLRGAIQTAGNQLAKRAQIVEPNVLLQFDADPYASGVIVPHVGPTFEVQVPGILPSMLEIMRIWQARKSSSEMTPTGPVKPVATSSSENKVTAAGMPTADPMAPSPAFEPAREYTNNVRDALINTLLDFGTTLPLNPGETVTIIARDMPQPIQRGALTANESRQLILTMKTDDLIALRGQKITRDEAKQKIVDTRF